LARYFEFMNISFDEDEIEAACRQLEENGFIQLKQNYAHPTQLGEKSIP